MRSVELCVPPWELHSPNIDIALSQHQKGNTAPDVFRALALEHLSGYSSMVFTFTDGSKTDQGVGCAFVCGSDTRSFTLPSISSVYTSELIAILKALCFIQVSGEPRHVVVSDSLSSLIALRAFNPSDPLVKDIALKLTSLAEEGKEVSFCWIPSHVGIAGNELADAAARRAADRPCTRSVPVPARDYRQSISAYLRAAWQSRWDTEQQNKLRQIKPRLGSWPSSCRRARREEVALCRLRVGHTLATHRYLLCGEDKPRCSRCGSDLSVRHVLVSCRCYATERLRHFGPHRGGLSMLQLIGDASVYIGSVFRFLDAIGFKIIYNPG